MSKNEMTASMTILTVNTKRGPIRFETSLEWNEAIIGSYRGRRGGSFSTHSVDNIGAGSRNYELPAHEDDGIGFRVAEVPEPASLALLAFTAWTQPGHGHQDDQHPEPDGPVVLGLQQLGSLIPPLLFHGFASIIRGLG